MKKKQKWVKASEYLQGGGGVGDMLDNTTQGGSNGLSPSMNFFTNLKRRPNDTNLNQEPVMNETSNSDNNPYIPSTQQVNPQDPNKLFPPNQSQPNPNGLNKQSIGSLGATAFYDAKGIVSSIGAAIQNRYAGKYERDQQFNQLNGTMRQPYNTYLPDDFRGQMKNPMQNKMGGFVFQQGGTQGSQQGGTQGSQQGGTQGSQQGGTQGSQQGVQIQPPKSLNLIKSIMPNGYSGPTNINEFKVPRNQSNVEVEGKGNGEGEVLQSGNVQSAVTGPLHSEGGVPLKVPEGTKVLSDHLKFKFGQKKEKSYAEMGKPYKNDKFLESLKDRYADSITKTTAQLAMAKNKESFDSLYKLQQENKLEGIHGKQVQKETMKQEQPQMSKFGGFIPKFQGGNQFRGVNSDTQMDINAGVLDPSVNYTDIPRWQPQDQTGQYGRNKDWNEFFSRQDWVKPEFRQKFGRDFNFKNPNDWKWEQQQYDQKSLSALGKHYYTGQPNTPYGIDSKPGDYTFAQQRIKPLQDLQGASNVQINSPTLNEPVELKDRDTYAPGSQNPQSKYKFNGFMPIPLFAGSQGLDPIQTRQVLPQHINYRPEDIEPAINEANRGISATQKFLPVGSHGVSNINQAFATSYGQKQGIYNQDFNRKQQGRLSVDQANANYNIDADRTNLGEFQQFRDLQQRRDSAQATQLQMNRNSATKGLYDMNTYNNSVAYSDRVFHPWAGQKFAPQINPIAMYQGLNQNTGNDKSEYEHWKALNEQYKYEEEKKRYDSQKMGGKVKRKLNLKRKSLK